MAFLNLVTASGLQRSSLILDESIDRVLDDYCSAIYGTDYDDDLSEKRLPYVKTVLQHVINRDELRTVRALGSVVSVFNWLVQHERLHCPPDAEERFSALALTDFGREVKGYDEED